MKITVAKPTAAEAEAMAVYPIWEKEASTFDWEYDEAETCLLIEGEVAVTTEDGERIEFAAGDLVVFPKGLKCVWDIRRPVRKHYRLG